MGQLIWADTVRLYRRPRAHAFRERSAALRRRTQSHARDRPVAVLRKP
jgi:hypothetical protein